MEDKEIINLWRSYDKNLEQQLVFNKKNAEDITKIKIGSFLASMRPLKIFTILSGIVWVAFVDILIVNLFHLANPFFLVSACIQVLLTKLAVAIYLYQLILIDQVDFSDPVMKIQEKLARLKSSTLWVARLLFLQLPVWTTFYWNQGMLKNGNIGLYIIQLMVTLLFGVIAVWLFFNIKYENGHKKWFKVIFSGKEWTPLIKSMDLLRQVNDYK